MKKLMVLGILILFLLSACAPQGSDTAEDSDSITIVKNTGLTGTWSGPYAENMYVIH